MVEPLYCEDNGRPSIDPVVLFKMVLIQHLYGLPSLRRTADEVSANNCYRWFLGYPLQEETPHFSTVSYNFRHRFTEETVDRVFTWILDEVAKAGYLSPKAVFIDGTHVKANANTKKQVKEQVPAAARHYAKELMEEVNADREAHGKKPFDDGNDPPASPRKHKDNTSKKKLARRKKQGFRTVTKSTTDSDCGLFVKGEHNAIINSTYGCAGMRCMALPVVVVQESIADRFVAMLKEKAQKLTIGCAYDPATKLGPVVSAQHKANVCKWIQTGIDEGAELVLDGRDIVVPGYENGFFVGPTILDHVKPGMSVGDREIFGPVTLIKRVKDFDEGLSIMNANPFANGSVIFTQSGYYARKFEFLTDGGMVGINVGIPVPTAYFPFSGNKDSFFGDLHVLGKDGVRFYTRAKTVTKHWYDETSHKKAVSTWEGTVERV